MAKRYEVLHMDSHIGIYDPEKKKRLQDLYPTTGEIFPIKRKATAFEGGYNTIMATDLHKKFMGRKTITPGQYKKELTKYGRK